MNFDEKAVSWDNDTKKIERAKIVAREIIDFIQPNQNLSALEFGCGTGLLSFELKDFFKRITLVDNSEGMINVLHDKIRISGVKNFDTILINQLEEASQISKHDVLYTLMTLHHITDINKTLNTFNSLIEQDGFLCIADLVKEDGSFHAHEKDFDGHNGFDKKELTEILSDSNFTMEYYNECFEIEKEVGETVKKYPVFIMIGKKLEGHI